MRTSSTGEGRKGMFTRHCLRLFTMNRWALAGLIVTAGLIRTARLALLPSVWACQAQP